MSDEKISGTSYILRTLRGGIGGPHGIRYYLVNNRGSKIRVPLSFRKGINKKLVTAATFGQSWQAGVNYVWKEYMKTYARELQRRRSKLS